MTAPATAVLPLLVRYRAAVAAAGALALIAVLVIPLFAPLFQVRFVISMLMFVALASSWNLISGYTGYVSLGHVVFFGIGAYGALVPIARLGTPWALAILIGGTAAGLLALLIGLVALRLRGPYFAVATLGLNEVVRVLMTAWVPVTGGGSGLSIIPADNVFIVYYAMLGLALLTIGTSWAVLRSRFGLRLLAIREDEVGAQAMGVNTTAAKVAAFVLAAVFAGMVGGLNAWYIAYIEPPSVFFPAYSILMVVMAILGGMGTVSGPVIGAVALMLVRETLWVTLPFAHQAMQGVLIILLVLFLPGGLLSLLHRWRWISPTGRY